jgi:putative ABC transport system permease protein
VSTPNLRQAFRVFFRNPGFTAAAVICLALGIGATTAIFSVVNAVVLRPLPYAGSERMVRIFTEFPTFPNGGLRHFWVSPPELLDLRRELTSWQSIEAWAVGAGTIAGSTQPLRVTGAFITGGMMPMLGVAPLLGRTILPQDDRPGVPLVAVLSYGLWQRAYGGDPNVLGRDVRVDGKPGRVVGVMAKGFEFPPGETNPVEVWIPTQIDPARPGGRGSHFLSVLAKLKDGASRKLADDEIARMVSAWGQRSNDKVHGFHPKFHPLLTVGFHDDVVRNIRLAMMVLLGAVVLVLLISCVNVANLLLVRAEARRREIAVRKAMGAGLGRLTAQFATEGIILSLAGAVIGLAIAYGGLHVIVNTNAGSIPRVGEINIDLRVLLFTLAVSCATGIAFAMAPVFHVVAQNVHEALKAAASRTTATTAANRFRSVLVASEVALALTLLIGTGLMVKAFWRLQQVDVGVEAGHLLTARVSLPEATYAKPESRAAFWTNLRDRLASAPGAISASTATGLPPSRPLNANDTQIEGFVRREGGPVQNIDYWNIVSPQYFDTMRIRLVEGRYFDQRDGKDAPAVVVVNQTMARAFYGNQSAIGRRVRPGFRDPWRTIVGVVADVKNAGADRPAGTELYMPGQQAANLMGSTSEYALLRASGEPKQLAGFVVSQVQALEPSAAVSNIRTMDEVLSESRSRPRFLALLLTLFSSVSLVLAAVGIYGVISYAVAQRTNEIGIRMAMGAVTSDVLRLVLTQGLSLALIGAGAGAVAAFALTRFLRGLLFGVSAFDVGTFVLMTVGLIAVTAFASYIPARRAAAVDPVIALRYE